MVYRLILEEENLIKVYYEYRNYSLEKLAKKVKISPELLQNIKEKINLKLNKGTFVNKQRH